ncbi:dihydroorotate dehydrogenase electron transfer subunit [Thiovibrio sp. JS02]
MSQYQSQAEIVRQEHITGDIVRMTLRAPDIAASAKPGQFIMVKVSDGHDPLLRRPFSIHQATADGMVQILFKVLGKGTRILAGLEKGNTLNLVGPLGHGYSLEKRAAFCLVGGGMGIAPLYFLARELLRRASIPKLVVLLGARNSGELAQLAEDFRALGVRELHLATDDGSLGHHGYVAELMPLHMGKEEQWQVCSCGPHPMLHAVVKQSRALSCPCQVSLETMMACGIAACLGCAIPAAGLAGDYLHVCKDGPVFDANEVAWI